MPYAQLAYRQTIGNSKLGIDVAGCLLITDCDNLEQIGIRVDPLTLNTFYTAHGVYSYDRTDRANDDLSWWSVTKYCPQFVVKRVGTSGWPDSLPAKVEFRYRDHLGQEVTHFTAVADIASHSILDSWDMKVKTPAEYEHVYGQPIAWATYAYHTAATIPASLAPNVHISAPAAIAPSHAAPPSHTPTQLFLPGSVSTWHVYNANGPYTLPHAIHVIDPKMYGGLTYQILGNPAPNIYLIKTELFGEVAIYAGPDTVAQFPGTGHGEGENTSIPPQDSAVPVIEIVPAPSVAPTEPVADTLITPPVVTYTRLETPLKLVTKDGAQSFNFVSGTVVDNLATGTPFTAVGKAVLVNNDTYYMDNNSFGTADQTQHAPITVGIKTVDLSLPPKPAPTAGSGITTPLAVPTSAQSLSTSDSVLATSTSTVKPPTASSADEPKLPWQRMTFLSSPQKYLVKEDMKVVDFETGNKTEVKANTSVKVGGTFLFGGSKFYRSQKSIENKTWYGFPVTSLIKQDATNTLFNTNDDIDQLGDEAEREISKSKQAIIKTAGTTHGWVSRLNIKRGR